jgi:hypothetical protein
MSERMPKFGYILLLILGFALIGCEQAFEPWKPDAPPYVEPPVIEAGPVAVTSISLSSDTLSIPRDGYISLTCKIMPEDAADKSVQWASNKPGIVAVDQDGRIIGLQPGEALISVTALSNGKQASCMVQVLEMSPTELFAFDIPHGIITGFDRDAGVTAIGIPVQINGVPVLAIGEEVFKDAAELQQVLLPEGLKRIGDFAFYGSGLSGDIVIPNTVETVGYGAYADLVGSAQRQITIGEGVKDIQGYAFHNFASNGGLTIPALIERIGERVFEGGSFTDLTLYGPEELNADLFAGADFTGNLTLAGNIKLVPNGSFSGMGFTGDLIINIPITIRAASYTAGTFAGCTGFTGSLTLGS